MTDENPKNCERLAALEQEIARVLTRAREMSEELATLTAELCHLRSQVKKAGGMSAGLDREARREEVLRLRAQKKLPLNQIARILGVTASTIQNDALRLSHEGRFPVPLAGPDDHEGRRRNHVLRVWSWRSTTSEADVARNLGLTVEVVTSDLQWLADNGHVDNWDPPSRRSLPTTSPPPSPKMPEQPAPARPEPASREMPASTNALRTEVERQQDGKKQRKVSLRTIACQGHCHVAEVDHFGDGTTVADDTGHRHLVERFYIRPASKHSHDFARP